MGSLAAPHSHRLLLALLVLAWSCGTYALAPEPTMIPLDDETMADVTAREGIAVSLEFRINAKEDGEPVDSSECPTVGGLTGGASCRMGITFADRDGMWIALKNYRGIIYFKNIRLDATTFGGSTANRDITTYMGGYDPNNKPAIRLTSGNWASPNAPFSANCEAAPTGAACRTYMNQPNYSDGTTALNIARVTAEFDSGGVPGYLRDAVTGSAISLRMAHGIGLVPDPDNPPDVMIGPYTNEPARIRLDGRLLIHGFGF